MSMELRSSVAQRKCGVPTALISLLPTSCAASAGVELAAYEFLLRIFAETCHMLSCVC